MTEETVTDPKTGATSTPQDHEHRQDRRQIVRVMVAREQEGKEFGVIVLAEGLAEYLPAQLPRGGRVRRPRPHLAVADQPGPQHGEAGRGRIREAATARSGG